VAFYVGRETRSEREAVPRAGQPSLSHLAPRTSKPMTPIDHDPTWPLAPAAAADPGAATNRLLAALLLLLCGGVLVLSYVLTPSRTGWGTHILLGFPPCLFHTLVGFPCPFCGMTTAFVHMAHGHVAQAFACHVLGPVFFVGTGIVAVWSLVCLVRGTSPIPAWAWSSRVQAVVLVVLAAGWVVNVAGAIFRGGGR
jgi:hypothetical protein